MELEAWLSCSLESTGTSSCLGGWLVVKLNIQPRLSQLGLGLGLALLGNIYKEESDEDNLKLTVS